MEKVLMVHMIRLNEIMNQKLLNIVQRMRPPLVTQVHSHAYGMGKNFQRGMERKPQYLR